MAYRRGGILKKSVEQAQVSYSDFW
jgi:hypothetical protein